MSFIVKMYSSDGGVFKIIKAEEAVEFYTSAVIDSPFIIIKRTPLLNILGEEIKSEIRESIYGDVDVLTAEGKSIEYFDFNAWKEKRK